MRRWCTSQARFSTPGVRPSGPAASAPGVPFWRTPAAAPLARRTRGSFNPQSRNFRESPGSPPLLLCPSACHYDFDLLSRARLKKRKKAPSRRSGSRSQRPAALTFAARPPPTSGAPAEASFRRVEEAKRERVRRLSLSPHPFPT
ncbi:hypothetical protein MRX96_005362 [Rhipicephalus microplus]